jgi:hypothetical protein
MDKENSQQPSAGHSAEHISVGMHLHGCNNRFCGGRGHDPRCPLVTYLRVAIRDLCRLGIWAGVLKTSSNYSGLDCRGGAFSRILLGWLYWALAPTDTRSLDQAIQLTCDWVQVPARTAEKVHEIQLIAGKGGVPTVQTYLVIKYSTR